MFNERFLCEDSQFFIMIISMKSTFIFALMMAAAGVLSAADIPSPVPACVETLLCDEVKPEDAALFDKFFGKEMLPVEKGWDADTLTEYSSSWGHNEARKRVLCERIVQFAADGSTLRRLSCVRFDGGDGSRVNFKECVQRAVVPFVFVSNLVDIVDFNDERIYFDIVTFNPRTRNIERTEQKSWSRRELSPAREPLTEQEKSLFAELFPADKLRRTPLQWDAERRVAYSAKGWGRGNRYELKGEIMALASDGSRCRIACKPLERRGHFKSEWRSSAYSPQMVVPFVFARAEGQYLIVSVARVHSQSGDYLGGRELYYDFRTLTPMMETEISLTAASE